jgi:HPt (histidine-containing phosphotransfer) domain-containing protein
MNNEFDFNEIVQTTKKSFDLEDAQIFKLYQSAIKVASDVCLEIETALNKSDFKRIEKASHELKGATGSIRLDEIYAIVSKMETDAHEHKNRDYITDLGTIKKYFNKLQVALNSAQKD